MSRYAQPPIKAWGIFCSEKDKEACAEFTNTMQ
jgi:hypothetical protein